jgi:hypothetical protein
MESMLFPVVRVFNSQSVGTGNYVPYYHAANAAVLLPL